MIDNGTTATVEASRHSTLWLAKEFCEAALFNMRLYAAPAASAVCALGFVLSVLAFAKTWRNIKGKDLLLCVNIAADFCTISTTVVVREFLNSGLGSMLPLYLPHLRYGWVCKLWAYFWILGNSLSTNLLCLLAADRVYALYWPLHHRVHMTKSRYCAAVGAYVAVFACASSLGVLYEAYEYYSLTYCYAPISNISPLIMEAVQAYTTLFINGLVGTLVLLAGNVLLCVKIVTLSKRRASSLRGIRIRGARNLVAMACVYLLVSLPRVACYTVAFLNLRYNLWDDAEHIVAPLLLTLANILNYLFYGYCCVNWLMCGLYIRQFRETFAYWFGRYERSRPSAENAE